VQGVIIFSSDLKAMTFEAKVLNRFQLQYFLSDTDEFREIQCILSLDLASYMLSNTGTKIIQIRNFNIAWLKVDTEVLLIFFFTK
jgi:hypothetical protein